MISLEKFENESDMEYAIRILSAKVEHEIDLDWEELVSILNLDVHRDTLRKNWTSSSVSAYHVARYYEDKIKDLALAQDSNDEDYLEALHEALAKLERKEIEIRKEKVKLNDARRQYQQYVTTEARWEDICDMISREIQSLPNKRINIEPIQIKKTKGLNEASLLLSDWHVGMQIDSAVNTYNLDVLEQRVNKLLGLTIDAIKLHNIDRIHVEVLGDMVHGIIHLNGRLHQNENIIRQTVIVADILSSFVTELSQHCEVCVYSACGNHGRVSANVKESIKEENFEQIIWEIMKREIAKNNSTVKCIENEVNCETILYTLESGKVICGVHGHHEAKKLTPDTISRLERVLNRHIDELHEGHFHNPQYAYGVVINGTLGGSDDYAQNQPMHYSDKPSQTLVVHFPDGSVCNKVLVMD